MALKDQLAEHHKRWNVVFDLDNQFRQLKNRLLTLLDQDFENHYWLVPRLDSRFAFNLGALRPRTADVASLSFGASMVRDTIAKATDVRGLAHVLQCLFIAMGDLPDPVPDDLIGEVAGSVKFALDLSPAVGMTVGMAGRTVTLYPAGAELLDQEVVNTPLNWLRDYPKAATHFTNALKTYLSGDKAQRRNLLDDLRFAIEQLLKAVLSNSNSLENQKEPFLKWLKERGVHAQIRNLFHSQLFGPYTIYQNEAVKHAAEYSEKEIEFMIYLTGTYVRMIIQLARG